MSRIGKKVIAVPKGVTVTVHQSELEVKGPKGTLKTPIPQGISFKLEGEELRAERGTDDQAALHGLARALAAWVMVKMLSSCPPPPFGRRESVGMMTENRS